MVSKFQSLKKQRGVEKDGDCQWQALLMQDAPIGKMFASKQSDTHRNQAIGQVDQLVRTLPPRSTSEYSKSWGEQTDEEAQGSQHHRGESLHVNWRLEDVERMAREIYDETIADVHLSLFGYWIREELKHYELAKGYIRELALDQGYNVERIENLHLRKLLKDVHHVRSKEAMSKNACKDRHTPSIRLKDSYALFRSTFPNHFADPTVLLPSLRGEREVFKESGVSSTVSFPLRNYPPNTPDRPEPLSVKARMSARSNATPRSAYRSVSSPIGNAVNLDPILFHWNTVILEDTASHPPLAVPASFSDAAKNPTPSDDVFGIVQGGHARHSISLSNIRTPGKGENVTLARIHASIEQDNHYPLGASGVSSRASYDGANSLESIALGKSASNRMEPRSDEANDEDAFDTMHEYANESSILASVSTSSVNECQTRYTYASPTQALAPDNKYTTYIPYGRRISSQARREIMGLSPNVAPVTSHRPLPLRSYESEAHLFLTARARGASNHNRAQPAGSMRRDNKPASLSPEPMSQPPSLQSHVPTTRAASMSSQDLPLLRRSATTVERPRPEYVDWLADSHNERFESSETDAPKHTSMAMTLAEFPIPPMQNPVGAFPMMVSRVTSLAQSADPLASLAQACHSINVQAAYIRDLLEQTRTRGGYLPVTNWHNMSPFERSWRELNEELLIAIYGRWDVSLNEDDVEYVDCISLELRSSSSAHWVLDLFQHDDYEMF